MEIIIYIAIAFLGALFTSFFHLIGMRIPVKKTIFGRSFCDYCKQTLRLRDVIPIVGFIINRGRCFNCHQRVSFRYILVEVVGGVLFVLGYFVLGFTTSYAIFLILLSVMIVEAVSDLYYHHVIDRIWMIGFILLIPLNIISNQLISQIISSIVMFTVLYGIAFFGSKMFGKEALGGGDVKLYVFIGFTLSITNSVLFLFFASLFGLIYAIVIQKKKAAIPLVPFIAIGSIISFLFGQQIIDLYLNIILGV
jgi:leader peptidase (prepilin peptidase)/N-methyltransferase